jgi:hypothetical protein
MTTSAALLIDAFGRIRDSVHRAAKGMTPEQLSARVDDGANSIGWLLWHLSRVQDDHISELAGTEQAWTADGWSEKFGLPFEVGATGYGQTSSDVAKVAGIACDRFVGYHDDVHDRTVRYLGTLSDLDLQRIIDRLDAARHARRSDCQRDQRRPRACRPGGLRARSSGA